MPPHKPASRQAPYQALRDRPQNRHMLRSSSAAPPSRSISLPQSIQIWIAPVDIVRVPGRVCPGVQTRPYELTHRDPLAPVQHAQVARPLPTPSSIRLRVITRYDYTNRKYADCRVGRVQGRRITIPRLRH